MTAMRRIDLGGDCRQRLPIREPVWIGAIAGVGMAMLVLSMTVPAESRLTTSELAETSYNVSNRIGAQRIALFPNAWMPTRLATARGNGFAILLSPANRPLVKEMGPRNSWEDRSQGGDLPLVVNNRTERESEIDLSVGQSAVSAPAFIGGTGAPEWQLGSADAQPRAILVTLEGKW